MVVPCFGFHEFENYFQFVSTNRTPVDIIENDFQIQKNRNGAAGTGKQGSMMRKTVVFILTMIMAAGLLSACGSAAASSVPAAAQAPAEAAAEEEGLKIVATIFPAYDWAKNVLGENPGNAELSLLLDSGTDIHSYQPSADDILQISTCDLFIYAGGESDGWVKDVLQQAQNPDMVVLDLLEILGDAAKEEEIVEGMQAEAHDEAANDGATHDDVAYDGAEHDDEAHGEEAHHEEGTAYDEHVWLSVRNASVFAGSIADALAGMDPENGDIYRENAKNYEGKLAALDSEYQAAVSEGSRQVLLFGDRFPFRYLTEDYGLSYYAAFEGCSAETEASFETITFLAGKVKELGLPVILTIEGADKRLAQTIAESAGEKDAKILTMNSMQSVTAQEVTAGTTYLSVMEENLEVLRQALQ